MSSHPCDADLCYPLTQEQKTGTNKCVGEPERKSALPNSKSSTKNSFKWIAPTSKLSKNGDNIQSFQWLPGTGFFIVAGASLLPWTSKNPTLNKKSGKERNSVQRL